MQDRLWGCSICACCVLVSMNITPKGKAISHLADLCSSQATMHCGCRFGDLSAAAREEERARVYLPLDEYVALYLTPTNGLKTKKPRPRKVNGIRAVNLQAALLRPA